MATKLRGESTASFSPLDASLEIISLRAGMLPAARK